MNSRCEKNIIQKEKCEICHYNLPGIITRGNQMIEMRTIDRPVNRPYIIFEHIDNNAEGYLKTFCRRIYTQVFNLNNIFWIGRNEKADIHLKSMNISS